VWNGRRQQQGVSADRRSGEWHAVEVHDVGVRLEAESSGWCGNQPSIL
jgi:hypothetical protein